MAKVLAPNVRLAKQVFEDNGGRQWFAVEFNDRVSIHGWICLQYRASLYGPLVRPAIRFRTGSGDRDFLMPAALFGRGQWIGYVPPDTKEVLIAPTVGKARLGFDLLSCTSMTRLSLLKCGFSRNQLATLHAIWLRLTGARQQAHEWLRIGVGSMPFRKYHEWREASMRALDTADLDAPRSAWESGPHIRLVIDAGSGSLGEPARASLRSLNEQHYPHWSVAVVGPSPQVWHDELMASLQAAGKIFHLRGDRPSAALWEDLNGSDVIAPFQSGDVFPPYALATLAEYALTHPGINLAYADEESIDERGRYVDPELKPDWSPIFQKSRPYIGRALYFRVFALSQSALPLVNDLLNANELWASLCASAGPIGHIRRVLLTKACGIMKSRNRPPALAAPAPVPTNSPEPYATIIIPTKDRSDLLSACLSSLAITQPSNFEILIVDNGSREAATLALYESAATDPRLRILRMPGPFNFSLLCNHAASLARSRILVFLNNDTEVMRADWLGRLAQWATRPEVGAVGAKLLYPSGRLQHCGMVVGIDGYAGPVDPGVSGDHAGYLGRLQVPHEISAVTGACLAVEKTKFDAVGGFEIEKFPVDLGDVDLCLRLGARGWKTILAPEVVLLHRHSATRGRARHPEILYAKERAHFLRRWKSVVCDDPFFHPALSLDSYHTMLNR